MVKVEHYCKRQNLIAFNEKTPQINDIIEDRNWDIDQVLRQFWEYSFYAKSNNCTLNLEGFLEYVVSPKSIYMNLYLHSSNYFSPVDTMFNVVCGMVLGIFYVLRYKFIKNDL